MCALNIGYVSSIALFAKKISRADRDAALQPHDVPGEPGCLRDDVGDRFAALCDFALKRVVREADGAVKTLRIESGYGYAEHHKDWLRLGCEIIVEPEELKEAMAFLVEPSNAGMLDARIEVATKEFTDGHFRTGLFQEISCSFFLLQEPENA